MEKKILGETRLSRGASSPLARRTSSLFQLQQSQIVQRTHLVPVVLSCWPSRRQRLHWGSVSGAHLVVLYKMLKTLVSLSSRKGKEWERKGHDVWPSMVSHTWNLCSSFNPSDSLTISPRLPPSRLLIRFVYIKVSQQKYVY